MITFQKLEEIQERRFGPNWDKYIDRDIIEFLCEQIDELRAIVESQGQRIKQVGARHGFYWPNDGGAQ